MELRKTQYLRHFPNIENEQILKRYTCALVSDFLRHGQLCVTENYLAFHSNIFGYVTKLLIPLCGIEAITKEKTAKIIPNAIGITTPEGKYIFSSLISRDKTFNYMTKVWTQVKSEVSNIDFSCSGSGSTVYTSEEEEEEEEVKKEEVNDYTSSRNIKEISLQDSLNFQWKHSKIYHFIYYTAIILIVCLFISSGILLQRIFKIHSKYSKGVVMEKVVKTGQQKSFGSISGFLDDKLSLVSTVRESLETFYTLLDKKQDVYTKYFTHQKV
ncbi:protein Aster-C-like [Diorhabda carinulata]|uniref:protein Aster-C-like n=1 Tax=Diorhabda carinulata TaxID=1163345 RepID=UPI0025A18024|nr:protein Aster-C-like [Diorhabda carinulata]